MKWADGQEIINRNYFKMAVLYIIATPIGNLEDLSFRALRILKEVDLILCEDTRVTKKLLNYYDIRTPSLSYHQHSKLKKVNHILELLKQNKNLALVSDAGTPGISDPGNKLIDSIITRSGLTVKIIPIPGPSALTAVASISGFPMNKFVFMGFPPAKHKRQKFFEEVVHSRYPVVFYESPHRILKTLNELGRMFDVSLEEKKLSAEQKHFKLRAVVCRELTKKFETIYRGEVNELVGEIKDSLIAEKMKYSVKSSGVLPRAGSFGDNSILSAERRGITDSKVRGEFAIVVRRCNN